MSDLEYIFSLIGDTPVSEQICAALADIIKADYVPRAEFEELRAEVERLAALVGDTPVSEQINAAMSDR